MVTRTDRKLTGQHNQCPSCGELFNSNIAFSKHRTGNMNARHCLTIDGMTSAGMAKNSGGWWVTALNTINHTQAEK